jgi:hypothetical protein
MPTTHESLGGLVAVSGKGIKPLGYLTWFSVPDESVGLRKLKQSLAVHGLPPSLAPSDTKAINTFKRAMREQEGRHHTDAGVITETTVAQVAETPEDCVYQISRLVRDLDERVVEYPKAMRVIFDKRTEEIHFNPLGGIPRTELLPMMESIQDFYDKNGSKVTGAKVRGVVRNYLRNEPDEQRHLEGLSGENLRGKSGGIYFIPAKHVDQLQALSEALTELYEGRAYLHAVPLADGASEREIVRRHHVTNARQEMKEAMAEVKGLLSADRERAPRSDVVANQWARFRAIQRRASAYADLLKDEQEEIGEMGAILKKQLDNLIG